MRWSGASARLFPRTSWCTWNRERGLASTSSIPFAPQPSDVAWRFPTSPRIEMHLEVEEHLTLREAHRQATDLEEEIRTLPSLAGTTGANGVLVNIHIEPMGAHIATVDRSSGNLHGLADDVEAFVNGLRGELQALKDCHDVRVQKVERRIQLSCHCAMDGRSEERRVGKECRARSGGYR